MLRPRGDQLCLQCKLPCKLHEQTGLNVITKLHPNIFWHTGQFQDSGLAFLIVKHAELLLNWTKQRDSCLCGLCM